MKVLLSTLPREGAYRSWITPGVIEPKDVKYLPLGLLSLATNALQHDIEIIDPFAENWDIVTTLDEIRKRKPDVVGFTCATRWSYALYMLLQALKKSDIWLIAGGPHITFHAKEVLEWGADAVFDGPLAEDEFSKWLDDPYEGYVPCFTNILTIQFPERNYVDYKKYFFSGKVIFEAKKRMSMFSSIGCPNSCRFCSVNTKTVKYKRPEDVMGEMIYLQQLGAESVHIFDDNFNINYGHVSDILDEMLYAEWNMEWSCRGQVRTDLSLVPRMKRHGLKRIHTGIESLEDTSLQWMRKNHRLKDIEKFCKVMNENDIDMLAYFIVGCPTESTEYLDSLPSRIKDLGIKTPYINVLFPEPDTEYGRSVFDWSSYFKKPIKDFEIPNRNDRAIKAAGQIMEKLV